MTDAIRTLVAAAQAAHREADLAALASLRATDAYLRARLEAARTPRACVGEAPAPVACGEKWTPCPVCGRMFWGPRGLASHRGKMHRRGREPR